MQLTPSAVPGPRPLRRRGAALGALLALTATGSLAVPASALAAPTNPWNVSSPDGSVTASVTLDDGNLNLEAQHSGITVLDVDHLGIDTSAADLTQDISVTGSHTSRVQESYTMLVGKRHDRTVDQNELQLDAHADGADFTVVIRVADDGVAFSYELPGTGPLAGDYTIADESERFTLPDPGAPAVLQEYTANYENEYQLTQAATPISGNIGFPALFGTSSGPVSTRVLLTESNISGSYAALHLTHDANSVSYGVALGDTGTSSPPVDVAGSLTTPWRVAIIGDLGAVVTSTLVDDLADPTRLAGTDTSWISPGTSAWSWNQNRGSENQGNLALQKRFVDLAARDGWPYMVIDEGWKAAWVPRLVRYANKRGVDIIAWFNSDQLWTHQQRTDWFDKLVQWGVKGVKVDFMDSDSQRTFQWYDRILADTASHHLMINFHGASVPKGMQRTWPQIMSYEGVRGEENGRSATRDTVLPFTRNVVGSMDFTPVVYSDNNETTVAHETALPVLFESGWTHFADDPSSYHAHPLAETFLQQVPTTWDETHLVAGSPGDAAVLARRSGERWFVGGVTASSTSTSQDVPLSFLGAGDWLVQVLTDDSDDALDIATSVHTNGDTLTIPEKAVGGFTMIACPASSERTSCDVPVPAVPRTDVGVAVDTDHAGTGDLVTVSAVLQVAPGTSVTDVTLAPEVPGGWRLASGAPVTRATLDGGESLTGTWQLHVGNSGLRGDVDVTIAADLTTPAGQHLRSAGAKTITVDPPVLGGEVHLSDVDFASVSVGWGSLTRDTNFFDDPLTMPGPDGVVRTYDRGIEANANAEISVVLAGRCTSFTADYGLEDTDNDHPGEHHGSVGFQVLDQDDPSHPLAQSTSPIEWNTAATAIDVDVSRVQTLVLRITDAGDGNNSDHGVFADGLLHCAPLPDTTPPMLDVTTSPTSPQASGWFTQPVSLSADASDDESGVAEIETSNDGGDSWQPYSTALTFRDGTTKIRVRARDAAGNVSLPTSLVLRVDRHAPSTVASFNNSARTVEIGASDAVSGVADIEYRTEGDGWKVYTTPVQAGQSANTVCYRATDQAGNVSATRSVTVPRATQPKLKKLKVKATKKVRNKGYRPHHKVKVKVKVSKKLTDGRTAKGKVKLRVKQHGSFTTVKKKNTKKFRQSGGKLKLKIAKRYVHGKKLKVKAVYQPKKAWRSTVKKKKQKIVLYRR